MPKQFKNIAGWYLIFMTTTVFARKLGNLLCDGTYQGDEKFVQFKKKKN